MGLKFIDSVRSGMISRLWYELDSEYDVWSNDIWSPKIRKKKTATVRCDHGEIYAIILNKTAVIVMRSMSGANRNDYETLML